MTNMRENIKKVIGVEDDKQDDVLDILMSNVQSHLLGLFKKVDKEIVGIPSEAEYIIFEITIRRYNRIGSEGLKSELVEGHRIDFYDLFQSTLPTKGATFYRNIQRERARYISIHAPN